MKIWLVKVGEPLPLHDRVRRMRTGFLAEALLARGHQVTWWAGTFEHQRKIEVFQKDSVLQPQANFKLIAIKGIPYFRNVSLRRFLDHKLVAWKFRRMIRSQEKPDVIIAAMPTYDLAYEAVRFAKKNRIPIAVDVRDLWPDIFLERFHGWKRRLAKLLLINDYRKLRYLLRNAKSLLAMSHGILQWALHNAARKKTAKDRVFYLGYRKSEQLIQELPQVLHAKLRWDVIRKKKIILFVGTFGISYQLELVVDVARRMSQKEDVHFLIVGDGEKKISLEAQASGLKNITFSGWLDNIAAIQVLLQHAYIGLVPCDSVVGAFPNKPMEYLSFGLPLVSSLKGEFAELVTTEQVGLNYNPGNADELCSCINSLLDNPQMRDTFSQNAKVLFMKEFNAAMIYDDYAQHVESLFQAGRE